MNKCGIGSVSNQKSNQEELAFGQIRVGPNMVMRSGAACPVADPLINDPIGRCQ